jgi:leucyl aminopeptidase
MNPITMSKKAREILTSYDNVSVTILETHQLKALGLNLILAVDNRMARVVVIDYKPKKYLRTCALIGKAVTFDAGGANLKTNIEHIIHMHGDKMGGAVVLGMLEYVASQQLPLRVVAAIPMVENVMYNSGTRPGDIIRSLSGKTVRVNNTDAEGRLIVSDCVTMLSCMYDDIKLIMDFTTLTGMSEFIHCDLTGLIYTSNPELMKIVMDVGNRVGERIWPLPHWDEYYDKFSISQLADIDNDYTGCNAKAYTGAMFMYNFIPEELRSRWIHFDLEMRSKTQNDVMIGNGLVLGCRLLEIISNK